MKRYLIAVAAAIALGTIATYWLFKNKSAQLTSFGQVEIYNDTDRAPASQRPSNPHALEGRTTATPQFEIQKRVQIMMPDEDFAKKVNQMTEGDLPLENEQIIRSQKPDSE